MLIKSSIVTAVLCLSSQIILAQAAPAGGSSQTNPPNTGDKRKAEDTGANPGSSKNPTTEANVAVPDAKNNPLPSPNTLAAAQPAKTPPQDYFGNWQKGDPPAPVANSYVPPASVPATPGQMTPQEYNIFTRWGDDKKG